MSKEFLWVEKYRPSKIDDTILPKTLQKTFSEAIAKGELTNMLFTGTAGLGKTTVARALCDELDMDYIVINGSEEGNIDTLRGKIKRFASSISLTSNKKCVILDEADYLNPQSTQPALRGFIEEFSSNCRFILTCNFKNRIIEPLHSRCGVYEFNTSRKDMQPLCEQMLKRVLSILTKENVTCNDIEPVANLILKHAPDWRRVLNEVQRYSTSGTLLLPQKSDATGSYDGLFSSLKEKDFKKMRSWVVNNSDVDASVVFRAIYDSMYDRVNPSSIPHVVLILADYQYKNAFVADHELNMVACMTELMTNVEFN